MKNHPYALRSPLTLAIESALSAGVEEVPPELDSDEGRRLVLNEPESFPEEKWAVAGLNGSASPVAIRKSPPDFKREMERERNAMPWCFVFPAPGPRNGPASRENG